MGLKVLMPKDSLPAFQGRMVLFWRTLSVLSVALLSMALIAKFASSHLAAPKVLQGWFFFHLLPAVACTGMWLFARSKYCTPRALNVLDMVGVRAVCLGYALGALDIPPSMLPEQQALIPIAFALLVRAAILPSTPGRTLLVGVPAVLPIPLVALYARWGVPDLSPPLLVLVLAAAFWALFAVFASVIVSRMIYGLEEQVRSAEQLGQYTLEKKIGAGGMGVVYRARHALLRRPTAIKVLRSDTTSEHSVARFEREVQLTSRLHNPHTIDIYDFGRTPDGMFYYAMEYLEGLTLDNLVSNLGPQAPSRVVSLLRQVCEALDEAHSQNLIHRDIKPANIMLCNRGGMWDQIKVLDFGLVKVMRSDSDPKLSNVQTFVGTPQFMSPEAIISPDQLDGRSDLYSLGAVAYYLLCGQDVFEGKTVAQVCAAHIHAAPPPMDSRFDGKVPAELEQIVLTCLAKKPEDRPQTAKALSRLLEACPVAPWTEDDARAWWQEHGDRIASQRAEAELALTEPSSAPAATLAVDLKNRPSTPFAETVREGREPLRDETVQARKRKG